MSKFIQKVLYFKTYKLRLFNSRQNVGVGLAQSLIKLVMQALPLQKLNDPAYKHPFRFLLYLIFCFISFNALEFL